MEQNQVQFRRECYFLKIILEKLDRIPDLKIQYSLMVSKFIS